MLSIGSHASFFSIGCSYSFGSICNRKPDKAKVVDYKPATSPFVLAEVLHNEEHDSQYAQCTSTVTTVVNTTELVNGKNVTISANVTTVSPLESVTVKRTGSGAGSLQNWQFRVYEEDSEITPTNGEEGRTFGSITINEDDHITTCLPIKTIKKDGLVALVDPAGSVRDVAQMSRYYPWTPDTSSDYLEVTDIEIVVTERQWNKMATCSFDDKLNDEAVCDYVDDEYVDGDDTPQCRINGDANYIDCEVKRKGHGSWRNMGEKPSLKVKLKDRLGNHQYKLTLNNMAQDRTNGAEVTSYKVFRDYGVPASRARHVNVLFRHGNDTTSEPLLYVSVENADTPEFLAKHRLDGSTMWELERGEAKHELGPNYDIDKELGDAVSGSLNKMWRVIDKKAMFRFYAGELATAQVDGLCRSRQKYVKSGYAPAIGQSRKMYKGNNAHAVRRRSDSKYIFVPWGIDQSNVCSPNPVKSVLPIYHVKTRLENAVAPSPLEVTVCDVMEKCLSNSNCKADFEKAAKKLKSGAPGKKQLKYDRCEQKNMYAWSTFGLLVAVAIIVVPLAGPCSRIDFGRQGSYAAVSSVEIYFYD